MAWDAIRAAAGGTIENLFTREPDRLSRLVIEVAGLRFDFAGTHLSAPVIEAFAALAEERGFAAARDALFAGGGAEYPAERGLGAPESVAQARGLHARMRALIDAIEAEALGPVRHVLHLGQGGLATGPRLLADALGGEADRYDVAVVASVDGVALERVFRRFDPATTLVAVASRGFNDAETMVNAASALAWLAEAGVDDPYGRIVALTADPDRAIEWGVDETRVLPFAATLGEPQALWSSVGFAAALALGWDAFESLLEGAAAMDRHVRLAPLAENAPVLAAFLDVLEGVVLGGAPVEGVPAEERLMALPAHLRALGLGGGAVVEQVLTIEPGHALDEAHHDTLLVRAIAEGAAAMAADRATATILLDRLDATRLGALIAFYEHRAFVGAILRGVEPVADAAADGVEAIMRAIEDGEVAGLNASTRALVERALG